MQPVAIIGGGISGLATAWYLHQAGLPCRIIEPGRLGGIMQTDYVEGCVVEAGPDSFLTAKPWARELAEELGLGEELIPSNDAQRATWVWKGGQFHRLPEGLTMMVPGKLGPILQTPLLSWSAKLRGAAEIFRRPSKNGPDRSVGEMVRDHYGSEVLDYIAEPLLAGVYGANPDDLSAQSVLPKMVEWERRYGSLTRGLRNEPKSTGQPLFTTFRRGLAQLVNALIERLKPEVITGTVEKVEKGYRLRIDGQWMDAERIVVACRAEAVLPGLFPPIPYNDATVLALIYAQDDVKRPLNGFGFLVPKVERRHISACTWMNTKFSHRAAPGRVVLRCFVTGDPEGARAELREKMGITAEPIWKKVSYWPKAMPQYTVGHQVKLKTIEEMLPDFPGMYLAGNGYYGVGIPDCVRLAREVAAKVARDFRS